MKTEVREYLREYVYQSQKQIADLITLLCMEGLTQPTATANSISSLLMDLQIQLRDAE